MSASVNPTHIAEAQTILRSIGMPQHVVARLLSRVESYASLQVVEDGDGSDNLRSVGVSASLAGEQCGLHVVATDDRYNGILIDLSVSFEPESVEATHLGGLVRLDDAVRHLAQQISELSCLGTWEVEGEHAVTRSTIVFADAEQANG